MIPKSHEDFQLAEQDIHQAREVCPFLGGMAVEQANMWLEMAQKGKAMMEAEQTEPIKQPEPEESTIDIQKP